MLAKSGKEDIITNLHTIEEIPWAPTYAQKATEDVARLEIKRISFPVISWERMK